MARPPPCPLRPAGGSSALPCAMGQRGGPGGAGLWGQPAWMSRVGRNCIVGREAGARQGHTPGTAGCSSAPGRQGLGLARSWGARAFGSGGADLGHGGDGEKPGVRRAD